MTECNGLPLEFSSIRRQKIRADFNGGTLTSDAGPALLREVDKRIGLIGTVAACIRDPRQPAKITHDLRTLLAKRIFALAMGYKDLNDHDSLRDDPLLQLVSERGVDRQRPLTSASTLCRFENRIDRRAMAFSHSATIEASSKAPPIPADGVSFFCVS